MADLSTLRSQWVTQDSEEIRILRAQTIQESLNEWLRLQTAFEWQLKQTEALFGNDRREALRELQQRLLSITK